jgi:hypothetical protein
MLGGSLHGGGAAQHLQNQIRTELNSRKIVVSAGLGTLGIRFHLRRSEYRGGTHLLASCPPLSVDDGKGGGAGLDAKVRELSLLTLLACVCLGLAWAYEADYFAMFFAVTAAFAGIEAVRRSL